MAIREFTAIGRYECGLDAAVAGKAWAFVAVTGSDENDPPARMGVAIANEPGYMPIPAHWVQADTYDEMAAYAVLLNAAEGLSAMEASRIEASTIAAQNARKPAKETLADLRGKISAIRSQVEELQEEARAMWIAGGPDASAADDLHDELEDIAAALAELED